MAFIDLSRDLFENVTISLTPKVTYTSGSTAGITGSAYLMPLKSKRIKEIRTKEASGFEAFAEALAVFGITNLVHVSALGVKEKHSSQYMKSKLEGEKNIQAIFKPSVILRGFC